MIKMVIQKVVNSIKSILKTNVTVGGMVVLMALVIMTISFGPRLWHESEEFRRTELDVAIAYDLNTSDYRTIDSYNNLLNDKIKVHNYEDKGFYLKVETTEKGILEEDFYVPPYETVYIENIPWNSGTVIISGKAEMEDFRYSMRMHNKGINNMMYDVNY